MRLIFDKLPSPLINALNYALNYFFEFIPAQKTVSEVLKRDIFYILHYGRQANGR